MERFLIVAVFRNGTNMDEVLAVRAEEAARVAALRSEGRIGAVHISLARHTVFIEVLAAHAKEAQEIIATLPMAQWWDLELYPLITPTISE